MVALVRGTASLGVFAIRSGDRVGHRIWTGRFVGTMWGLFRLFRVMLFVLDALLRDHGAAALLICLWSSAPVTSRGDAIFDQGRGESAALPRNVRDDVAAQQLAQR